MEGIDDHSEYLKRWKEKFTVVVKDIEQRLENDEMRRAGGECVCEICGKVYLDHPAIRDYEWLNLLCDNRIVKL